MQILYVVVMTFTKASLLLLLLRLVQNRRMLIVVWSIFGFMCAFAMVSFWASVFHCTPPPYAWNRMDKVGSHKGSCGNFKALQYWVPAGSILMDIVLWLLPLRLIYPLKLPRAQKVVLYMVFILGAMWVFEKFLLLKWGSCSCIVGVQGVYFSFCKDIIDPHAGYVRTSP